MKMVSVEEQQKIDETNYREKLSTFQLIRVRGGKEKYIVKWATHEKYRNYSLNDEALLSIILRIKIELLWNKKSVQEQSENVY